MTNFLFAYHDGTPPPEAPEDMQAEMERWKSWIDDIGPSVVDPGNPVGMSKTVSGDGVADGGEIYKGFRGWKSLGICCYG